ncbi:MAG TPA: polysaccharide deacetylase family protein [Candidatus Faecimonas gallistercoris]|nr:polysaccharide deacetylase family protein [Candidatus Faecimonas gallistercoris]
MLKRKLIQVAVVIVLVLFSFYYTNKTIDIIKETDPLMKQIKEESKKYQIPAENAKIKENKITPGKNGKEVDYDETYQKMKRYGTYNESLTVFKETTPTVSLEDTYDKFISGGNEEKKAITLVFKITNESNPKEIIRILNQENIIATFFIDGLWLENNLSLVKQMLNYELEILSYNNRYEEIYFSSAIQYLKNVTGEEANYCYAEYDNKTVIDLCSKLKLHTIVPTIKIASSPFLEVKKQLQNAAIISLPINTTTEIELKTVIDYIKSRGYKIVTLKELLSESLEK